MRDVAVERGKLAAAGFDQVDVEPTRIYKVEDAKAFLESAGPGLGQLAEKVDGKFMSAFVRAVSASSLLKSDSTPAAFVAVAATTFAGGAWLCLTRTPR